MNEYDVIIVGGGPAGLTCGLYLGRANVKVLLIEKLAPGGWIAITEHVDNYPGLVEPISGAELASRIEKQARKFGLQIQNDEVLEIKIGIGEEMHEVRCHGSVYKCRFLVAASGTFFKKLGVPGENKFFGRGVSICATCDAPLYRNKPIAVIGGGDSACQEALYLARFASEVTIVHRRDKLRAVANLAQKAMNEPKIQFAWNSLPLEILGNTGVIGLRIRNKITGEESVLNVDGVFIYIGLEPNLSFAKDIFKCDEYGFIIANERMLTNVPRIYAIGDVRSTVLRQVVTACADGAVAAQSISEDL